MILIEIVASMLISSSIDLRPFCVFRYLCHLPFANNFFSPHLFFMLKHLKCVLLPNFVFTFVWRILKFHLPVHHHSYPKRISIANFIWNCYLVQCFVVSIIYLSSCTEIHTHTYASKLYSHVLSSKSLLCYLL